MIRDTLRPRLYKEASIYYIQWIKSIPEYRIIKTFGDGGVNFVNMRGVGTVIKFRHGHGSNLIADAYIFKFNRWMKENYPDVDMSIIKTSVKIKKRKFKKKTTVDVYPVNEWMQYSEYLKSPQWKEISERCKSRAGYKCECCGSSDNLNTHHYNYLMAYKERHCDLFCLCNACHYSYHKKVKGFELPKDSNLPRESRLMHIILTIKK